MARTGAGQRLSRRNFPYAINFPGLTSAYVSMGNNYTHARTDPFSVWGYFIARSLPDASNNSIFRKFSTTTAVGWGVFISGSAGNDTGSLQFLFGSSASARLFQSTVATIKFGVPYFYGMAYDGSEDKNGLNLILIEVGQPLTAFNAKNVAYTNAIAGTTTEANNLCLGLAAGATNRQWDGSIWGTGHANAALTIAQFQSIYYDNIMPASAQSLWLANSGAGNGTSVADEIGAITGTLVGTTTWTPKAYFQPRLTARPMTNDITFDTNSDNVSWSDNNSLDVTNFTVETWVKFTSLAGASQDIISKYDQSDAAQRSFDLFLDSSNRLLGLVQISGSPTSTTTTGAFVPVPGVWYHITFTFDGANGIIYVNGKEITRSTAAGSVDNSTAALRFGLRTNGTTQGFLGSMALCRIFGTAATAAQVQDLYFKNLTFATPIIETLMSEGSGSSLGSTGSYAVAGTMTSVGWDTDVPIKTRTGAAARTVVS